MTSDCFKFPNKMTLDCFDDPAELKANSDISGPGVITGFLGTGLLMIVLVFAYYVFVYNPSASLEEEQDGDITVDVPEERYRKVNPVDYDFLRSILLYSGRWHKRKLPRAERRKLEITFNKCVLGLCDAQSFTGIGILVSGYVILDAGISAYHWQIMVYLAWLANLTHMSGLTLLRKYLRSNPKERTWRLLCMAILLVLLLVAEIPTAFFNWDSYDDYGFAEVSAANATSYARCFYDMRIARERFEIAVRTPIWEDGIKAVSDTSALQNMVVTVLLLVFNFFTRVTKIMDKPSQWAATSLRAPLSRWWRRKALLVDSAFLRSSSLWTPKKIMKYKYFFVKQMLAVLLLSRLYADIYTSMLSEIYWLLFSAIWAITRLFMVRASVDIDENEMTFGQILAVLLLLAPLVPVSWALVMFLRRGRWVYDETEEGLNIDTARDTQVGSVNDIPGQPEWLTKNYYHTHWMVGARHAAEYQIVIWSLLLVIMSPVSKRSTFQRFQSFMIWFFISQPLLSYCYIFLGILYEDAEESHREDEELHMPRRTEHRVIVGLRKFQHRRGLKFHVKCPIMLAGLCFLSLYLTCFVLHIVLGPGGLLLCYIIMMLAVVSKLD